MSRSLSSWKAIDTVGVKPRSALTGFHGRGFVPTTRIQVPFLVAAPCSSTLSAVTAGSNNPSSRCHVTDLGATVSLEDRVASSRLYEMAI